MAKYPTVTSESKPTAKKSENYIKESTVGLRAP